MPSAFMSMSAMICDPPMGEPCPRCCYRGNCVTPRLCIGDGALTLHQPIRPERPLSTTSRHLSSYRCTWPNVCIRATARQPGAAAMGAPLPDSFGRDLAESRPAACGLVYRLAD